MAPPVGSGVGRLVSSLALACLMIFLASLCGCTPFKEYVQNGFKVGPNYCQPAAPVAQTVDRRRRQARANRRRRS